MAINDPVGDLLTRIRNAQMRGASKVATLRPRSLRSRVLDVLVARGLHPRLFAEVSVPASRSRSSKSNSNISTASP